MAGEFKAKWAVVLDNGYEPVPIKRGTKACVIDDWSTIELTPEVAKEWASNGHAKDGLGIRTRLRPFADFDIKDKPVLARLIKLFRRELKRRGLPMPLKRIGDAPKCGYLFRTDQPFPKISSPAYLDSEGRKAQVEILCDGRQFVAFAIHPDTKKPYRWVSDGKSPENIKAADLPLMDRELGQWIVDRFVEIAEGEEWEPVRTKTDKTNRPAIEFDEDIRPPPDWDNKKKLIESALDAIDPSYWGDHDEWIDLAMALHHESEGSEEGFELFDEISSQAPKYNGKKTPRDVWDSIRGDVSNPKTAGYIFDIAKEEYGWNFPKKEIEEDEGKLPLAYFDVATVELDKADNYLIDGVLDKESLAMVFGNSSAGKTFFMLHMSFCIASEKEFFGRLTRNGLVLYVAAESGRRIANRVVAARREFKEKNTPIRVITSNVNLYKDKADLKRIIKAVKDAETQFGMPAVAIIIDTLARATPGMNENSSEDMGKAIGHLDELRNETGAAVVLVHHSGKDETKGARGWSGLHAAVDHEIEIKRDGDVRSADLGSKQRDTQDKSAVTFSLKVVELFEREDGQSVTTCVVEELNMDAPKPQRGAKKRKIPAQKQAVLDIINDLLNENHEVTVEDAREACAASPKVCDSQNRKTRWSAFDRALDWLTHEKLVFVNDRVIEQEEDIEI
jgi:hypothetical protein